MDAGFWLPAHRPTTKVLAFHRTRRFNYSESVNVWACVLLTHTCSASECPVDQFITALLRAFRAPRTYCPYRTGCENTLNCISFARHWHSRKPVDTRIARVSMSLRRVPLIKCDPLRNAGACMIYDRPLLCAWCVFFYLKMCAGALVYSSCSGSNSNSSN